MSGPPNKIQGITKCLNPLLAPLVPGFLVVHANLPEQLRALVVQWTKAYPLAVLESETVLVQSNGIAQWLKLALAADPDPADADPRWCWHCLWLKFADAGPV